VKEWLARTIAGDAGSPGPRRLAAGTLGALALVGIVGYLDFRTGSDYILAILYLVPILLATLYLGRGVGVLVAAASAGAWICGDVLIAPTRATLRPLLWNTGTHMAMYVIMIFFLSGLKEALLVERRQRLRLEDLDRLKNQLLGVAAHDLRSPTAVVSMYAEILRKMLGPGMDESQRRVLDVISARSGFMLRLIGDVLDLSRIEAGVVELAARPGDYGGFVAEQVRLLGGLGAARGAAVKLETAGPAPPLVFDRDRMEQVLSNMVGNALKFSPPGGTVTVRLSAEEGGVVTRVSDQGPGIPPDERERIFMPFQRGSAVPAGGERGTGLGLAISRKIVEAHGGRIGVESVVGRGSTFWYVLPLPGPAGAPPPHGGAGPGSRT
jgi:signal transduction histidine kinase